MMTVPQKKYFCNRIDEITLQKIEEIPKVADLYDKQMAQEGLIEGKITYPTKDMFCGIWPIAILVRSPPY
jgi:hypothetical protein